MRGNTFSHLCFIDSFAHQQQPSHFCFASDHNNSVRAGTGRHGVFTTCPRNCLHLMSLFLFPPEPQKHLPKRLLYVHQRTRDRASLSSPLSVIHPGSHPDFSHQPTAPPLRPCFSVTLPLSSLFHRRNRWGLTLRGTLVGHERCLT